MGRRGGARARILRRWLCSGDALPFRGGGGLRGRFGLGPGTDAGASLLPQFNPDRSLVFSYHEGLDKGLRSNNPV